ncbi:hypothetical protein JZX76_15455 [Haloarcula hispanica]|uniref:Uncharacterized protein n=1 Tax=Haloarcula hispanica TaxID=51589 RepID=A0A482TA37_HALHI|nr:MULTISPECIES: hypothetical protein [Haloarcula]AJF26096.1 hypothetical protein SG26_10335 [Haloarcula sp. CBA1115]KZX49508.1 hypothetical protein AV929_17485 [Haloarcula sp. K1]MCJ0620853.1 hypothetical protein [Haloarcula hispanica]RYJ11212.1 hypothetical protein ELS20_15315 [Haloarcula hispanica]
MRVWVRAVIVLVLCLILGGLFVHAAVTEEQRSPYPDAADLSTGYESYVGQHLMVFGTVTETGDGGMAIRAESDGTAITLRVTGTEAAVEPGGVVQVYGTLESNQTIAAERVEVVNSSRWAEFYKYGASAVGALGFLLLFFRYWRIDRETWTMEARNG